MSRNIVGGQYGAMNFNNVCSKVGVQNIGSQVISAGGFGGNNYGSGVINFGGNDKDEHDSVVMNGTGGIMINGKQFAMGKNLSIIGNRIFVDGVEQKEVKEVKQDKKRKASGFVECDTCLTKPKAADLCAGCLNNKALIVKKCIVIDDDDESDDKQHFASITITLQEGAKVENVTYNSNCSFTGSQTLTVNGNVDDSVKSANGSIIAQNTGSVSSTNGDCTIKGSVSGKVSTTNGSITVSGSCGSATSVNGSVRVGSQINRF